MGELRKYWTSGKQSSSTPASQMVLQAQRNDRARRSDQLNSDLAQRSLDEMKRYADAMTGIRDLLAPQTPSNAEIAKVWDTGPERPEAAGIAATEDQPYEGLDGDVPAAAGLETTAQPDGMDGAIEAWSSKALKERRQNDVVATLGVMG